MNSESVQNELKKDEVQWDMPKIPEAELENLDAKSDYKISEDLEFRMRLDIRKVEQAPILNLKENKFYQRRLKTVNWDQTLETDTSCQGR